MFIRINVLGSYVSFVFNMPTGSLKSHVLSSFLYLVIDHMEIDGLYLGLCFSQPLGSNL